MSDDRVTFDAVWTGDGFAGETTFRIDGERLVQLPADPRTPTSATSAPTPGTPAPALALELAPDTRSARPGTHLGGTLFPRLTDHHVHLGLVDPVALFAGGITHAVDLGWIPAVAASWLADSPLHPEVAIAGALLTAPGGYPVRSGWAPDGAAREVGGPRQAREAVREQVMSGASRIKVALNTDAGETVDDTTLRAIVEEAAHAGIPVVAHAQGVGQAERAVRAGVAQLAHTPFSERVADDVVAEAVRRGMTWISTLDIHGWGVPAADGMRAVDNLRRFHAAGGRVLYGTDLGNGPLPLGPNPRELAALIDAGLDRVDLLRAIAGDAPAGEERPPLDPRPLNPGPLDPRPLDPAPLDPAPLGPRIAWISTPPPADLHALPAWLASARGLRVGSSLLERTATRPSTPATRTPATRTPEGLHP